MWVTSLGLAGEAGIFASRPFYPMFSGVPNGPLRLSPPQVHAAVHNSGDIKLQMEGFSGKARVRYCNIGDYGYLIGLEFADRYEWDPEKWAPRHLLTIPAEDS